MTVNDRLEPPPGFGDVRCPHCRVWPLEAHLSDCPEPERLQRLFAEQYRQRRRWTVKPIFAWYDMWIGAFWDEGKRRLYIFPVPTLGVVIQFPTAGR